MAGGRTGNRVRETARLFFALWPSPEIQQALAKVALALKPRCGGRAIPAGNIHLTLAFLGSVERDRLPAMKALAGSIEVARFELILDRIHYWRHNRIVWAGVSRCPAAIASLVDQLQARLSGEGFRFEQRPYVPHITLLRDARRAPAGEATTSLAWPVAGFALMESVPGRRGSAYQALREWPLAS